MKTLLACSAIVAALGFVARADDPAANPHGPTLMPGTSALVMPVDAAGPPGEPAPLMMPQALPHYYGRGEWPGYGGCGGGCSSCGKGTGGMCACPRSYHLHLWDDYCYETTRCPNCGCGLGSLIHHVWCERQSGSCGCAMAACTTGSACCGQRSCASPGCGGRADEGAAAGPAPSPRPAVPVPPPPVTEKKIDMKTPPAGEPMPKQPAKDSKEKTGNEPSKTSRVVPDPSSASLLDRLFPWRTSGTR